MGGEVVFEICFLEAYNLGVVILDNEFQLFMFLEEAIEVPLNYFSHYQPVFIFFLIMDLLVCLMLAFL